MDDHENDPIAKEQMEEEQQTALLGAWILAGTVALIAGMSAVILHFT